MGYRWLVATALVMTILGGGLGPMILSSSRTQAGTHGTARGDGLLLSTPARARTLAPVIAHVIPLSAHARHSGATGLTPRGDRAALKSLAFVPPPGASPSVAAIGPPHSARQVVQSRNELRRRILDTIGEDPGVHYRELLRRVDCANGTLSFHLHQMERAQLINHVQSGSRCLFYLNRTDPRTHLRLAGTIGRVLIHLRRIPGSSTQEVAHSLNLLPSDASYHLHNLRSMDLARATRVGRRILWYPMHEA